MSRAEPPSNELAAKNPNKAVDGLDVGMNDGTADGTGEEVGDPTNVCAEPERVSTTGTATAVAMMLAVMNDAKMALIRRCTNFFSSASSSRSVALATTPVSSLTRNAVSVGS
jgi:hypothetical protein